MDWVALFKSNTIKYPVIPITLGRYDHSVNAKVKAETDWHVVIYCQANDWPSGNDIYNAL